MNEAEMNDFGCMVHSRKHGLRVIQVDPEWAWVLTNGPRWFVHQANVGGRYVVRNVVTEGKRSGEKLHRVLYAMATGRDLTRLDIDHINGDGLDNRLANLRHATRAENVRNTGRRADNKSGYKGVHFDRVRGLYKATVRAGGKQQTLGFFEDVTEAALVAARARVRLHAEFVNHGRRTN